MMQRWTSVLGGILAAAVVCGGAALADGGGVGGTGEAGSEEVPCPNERACSVMPDFFYAGKAERCGLGIRIFGVGGAIFGELCHDHEILIPAHQECHGAYHEGTRCVFEAVMPTRIRDCECGGAVLPFINTGIPASCNCTDWLDNGTVEDFMTEEC